MIGNRGNKQAAIMQWKLMVVYKLKIAQNQHNKAHK